MKYLRTIWRFEAKNRLRCVSVYDEKPHYAEKITLHFPTCSISGYIDSIEFYSQKPDYTYYSVILTTGRNYFIAVPTENSKN